MYCWVFTLNGHAVLGRTWEEFKALLKKIRLHYGICKEIRLPIYIHNLAFEAQFFLHRFKWAEVFALSERQPIRMLTEDGFEFRCSFTLSGYALASVGKQLKKYKVEKMEGDLDYSLIRHTGTPLTEKEWGYVLNDGLVVSAYIQELIEKYDSVVKIPMTKTGFVRNYCRSKCFYEGTSHSLDMSGKYRSYHALMKRLSINDEDEYKLLKRAFQGGFTHACMYHSGKTLSNVTSYDFTSSYPAVMVTEKFPMSRGKWVEPKDRKEFLKYLKIYCCVFDIELIGVEAKNFIDHPISVSRCISIEDYVADNGRVVKAGKLVTTITNIDYEIYRKFYRWKNAKIGKMIVYFKDYLPKDFLLSVLGLYKDKTELKGVEDEDSKSRYAWSKELLNSCYGMAVTDFCKGTVELNPDTLEWTTDQPNISAEVKRYNRDKRRFLFYPWGVFVTAYARRNLFSGLLACKTDYIYADTDSVKILHAEDHERYFKRYNSLMKKKIKISSETTGIPLEMYIPKTIKGEIKPIGYWDWEGFFVRFRTLGSKRYMVEYEQPHEYTKGKWSKYSITIAGVNKKTAIPGLEAMAKKENKDMFDLFEFGLTFDSTICGKNLHTYIDSEHEGTITDYLGNKGYYHEYSAVHLEPTSYLMESTPDYLRILQNIQEGYYLV